LLPVPAFGLSAPKTLATERDFGSLAGPGPIVDPSFDVEYLGASWTAGPPPSMRFRVGGTWTAWRSLDVDHDLPSLDGRTYAELVPVNEADAYQVRGNDRSVDVTAINTTDGPRSLTIAAQSPEASGAVGEPTVISRAGWGADESYRFDPATGTEVWPPAFYRTQKLTVHHTAGSNDPTQDYAATVRAIYYYHAVTRGYGDIGYNFLVDPNGNIYKGRWSGPGGSTDQSLDTSTGESSPTFGVTAAHVGGYNSGNVGIAVMGDYTTATITPAAKDALESMLAWEADHDGLDPQASSTYTNPVNGVQAFEPNISGHRDWAATECPGDTIYAELPQIRSDVAAKIAASNPPPLPPPTTTTSYSPSSVTVLKGVSTGDPVSNLSGNDATYFRVNAAKASGKYVANWYGQATITQASPTQLVIDYDGSNTRSVTQTLYVYNFQTASWNSVASSTVSTADQPFTWSTTTPASYVSASGQLRLRVYGKAGGAFTSRGDLMQFTVTS
jgi:hypothetical protein